jgi:hypothetical protein
MLVNTKNINAMIRLIRFNQKTSVGWRLACEVDDPQYHLQQAMYLLQLRLAGAHGGNVFDAVRHLILYMVKTT